MVQPLDIRRIDEREIFIAWDDGHRSLYDYEYLRLYCPCAGCGDELSGRRMIRADKIAKDIRPLQIEPVGRYALRFQWSDSHQTGIYSFEYLRSICPCASCEPPSAA